MQYSGMGKGKPFKYCIQESGTGSGGREREKPRSITLDFWVQNRHDELGYMEESEPSMQQKQH